MNAFLAVLAAVDLVITGYYLVLFLWGTRRLQRLEDCAPLAGEALPTVSIVVAARNEERDIEPALQSLLELDYPGLEIVAVDDRSQDRTGEILDRLAGVHERLQVVHVAELPAGWLGKNHALDRGAAQARGELLLFTDADVVMHPATLRRAVAFAQSHQLDHLAAFFRVEMPSWMLESFVVLFMMYFFAYFKPWKVSDPRSPAHVGIGGFNLLRADVYRRIGTHRAIALRPDDDVKLGKLVKKHGFRQGVVMAMDSITVRWYASISELIRGLEKNAFSGIDYSVPLLIGSSLFALVMHFGPFVAVGLATGLTRWLWGAEAALLLGMAAQAAWQARLRLTAVLGFPLAVLLFVFIQWRTMILNLWHGGIRWRGTFYSLAELKANKV